MQWSYRNPKLLMQLLTIPQLPPQSRPHPHLGKNGEGTTLHADAPTFRAFGILILEGTKQKQTQTLTPRAPRAAGIPSRKPREPPEMRMPELRAFSLDTIENPEKFISRPDSKTKGQLFFIVAWRLCEKSLPGPTMLKNDPPRQLSCFQHKHSENGL